MAGAFVEDKVVGTNPASFRSGGASLEQTRPAKAETLSFINLRTRWPA
jgi:hypothetical protein